MRFISLLINKEIFLNFFFKRGEENDQSLWNEKEEVGIT